MVLLVPEKGEAGCLRPSPDLARELLRRLSQEQCLLMEQRGAFTYASVRTRLIDGLLKLSEKFGAFSENGLQIKVPLSLADLAQMAGASVQTTSQELHALANRGVIKLAWPTLFILDRAALARLRDPYGL
ncbi:MAG: Crp/Fnr family transcriptional regulator [Candidatus Bipolaricaulaceae bacterium]